MRRKHLLLAAAAVFAAGGLWFAGSTWRTDPLPKPAMDVHVEDVHLEDVPEGSPTPARMLQPPDPSKRFTDFTPEQRVEFARRGHGPGG